MEDDRRHSCTRCDATFATNAELQTHRREHHGEEVERAVRQAEPEVKRIQKM